MSREFMTEVPWLEELCVARLSGVRKNLPARGGRGVKRRRHIFKRKFTTGRSGHGYREAGAWFLVMLWTSVMEIWHRILVL